MEHASTQKIRVLIADDSLFMRTYFSGLLGAEPDIEVVGTASSGDEVVSLASELYPDVITMDYHMPGKNGIDATAEIMKGRHPLPSVIMLSAFSGQAGSLIKRKLELSGAHIIEKPSGEVSLDIEKIGKNIVQKVKEVGYPGIAFRNAHERAISGIKSQQAHSSGAQPAISGVVIIGASTGGPPLIEQILTRLSPPKHLSIVIVQHMSKYFTELFSERLNRVSGFPVRELKNGDVLSGGEVRVIPGGYTLATRDANSGVCVFDVNEFSGESHEAMIDSAMKEIATCYGKHVMGILLSGMGHDGTEGLISIRAQGGVSVVQDPTTATVSSMPANALEESKAEVLQLSEIPARIERFDKEISR